ncbi:MAG TPA: FHA domain-containing protein [Gammaproteobacteria bacterium]|nr:FHA domain-containing protein [Gammaproteobacteria bacterium]
MTVRTAIRVFAAGLRRAWPLRLDIGGNWQTFVSEEQYSSFLAERIEMNAGRIEDLASLDGHGVQRELRHTRRSHQNAVDILVRSMETRTRLRYLWGLLDVSKVPDEHDWQSILFAAGSADNISDSALRLTLTHYVHYLEARREILESMGREWRSAAMRGSGKPVVPNGMRQDMAPISRFTTRRNQLYARLPRRRAVNLDMNARREAVVYLARNRVVLKLEGARVVLQQQDGTAHLLRVGRNMVGRSAQCEVCMDAGHSDISRQHLLIEVAEGNQLRLTDLSSRGTYMPPDMLDRLDSNSTSQRVH